MSANAVKARQEGPTTNTRRSILPERCLGLFFASTSKQLCDPQSDRGQCVRVEWLAGPGGGDAAGVVAARQLKIQTSNLPPPHTHKPPTDTAPYRCLPLSLSACFVYAFNTPATAIVQGLLPWQIENGGQQSWRFLRPFQHFDDDKHWISTLLSPETPRTRKPWFN